MSKMRIRTLLALLTLALSTAATAQGYNTYFSFSAPTEAFVGQQATYSLLFGLNTTHPPAGITSNREVYSGSVNFGNGSVVSEIGRAHV